MPVDQTNVALNICTRLAVAADSIMRGVEQIQALKEQKESAGIDFTSEPIETALASSSLKHASGDAFNSVITSGAQLKAWLEANFHDDNLQKVRSGGLNP